MIKDLIFCNPEDEGINSSDILAFIDKFEARGTNLHSFLFARNGKIVAEGYYPPFNKDMKHRLYSSSKTVVALAVGKLVTDGLVKVTDKLADKLPELSEGCDEEFREVTIEDVLKMALPNEFTAYAERDYDNWGWTIFNHPKLAIPNHPSGSIFNYNTGATYILCVLVKKLTGKEFLDYLRPVFDEIGVEKDIWCIRSPEDISWGGSGVQCTMRDFAKIAEFMMKKGYVNGKQLIDRSYMDNMTSKQIATVAANNFPLSDRGYGYQTWITSCGFAMSGLGEQMAFCFPEKDFLFVCNGDTQGGRSDLYESLLYDVYDNISDCSIEINEGLNLLQNKLANLKLKADIGEKHSNYEKKINCKVYRMKENPLGWKWFKFEFDGDKGTLYYENARGEKKFEFALNDFLQSTFPETHYYGEKIGVPAGRELKSLFTATWIDENRLFLRAYIIDCCFGNLCMTFGFKDNKVGIYAEKHAEWFLDDYNGFGYGETF